MGIERLSPEQRFIVQTFALLISKEAPVSTPALKELFTYYTKALTDLSGFTLDEIQRTTFYCMGQMAAYAELLGGDPNQKQAEAIALKAVTHTNGLLQLAEVEQTLEAELLASVSTKH